MRSPSLGSASLCVLSEQEKIFLMDWGIPADYLNERAKRAAAFALQSNTSTVDVLLHRWQEDKGKYKAQTGGSTRQKHSTAKNAESSFDIDDFFNAALRKTYGEDFGALRGSG